MTMSRAGRRRELALYLLCAAVTAAAFFTGILNTGKVWEEMEYYQINFHLTGELQYSFNLERGDSYGVKSRGPFMSLSAGKYLLKCHIDGDGENIIRLTTDDNAQILPSEIRTAPGKWEEEIEIELTEAIDNFQILVDFCDGTWMDVVSISLSTPKYADRSFMLLFVLVGVCMLYSLHIRGALTAERRQRWILMIGAVILVSFPAFKQDMSVGHDALFHAARIENIADGLRAGQFPVRVGGFSHNGYGAVTSAFYPELFLYPFALMFLAGASIQFVFNTYLIAVNAVSAVTMYACAKRLFGDRQIGACAAVLYTMASYRLVDVFTRCAIGEATAMAALPIFILGLWYVVMDDRSKWWVLVVGATGVFQSHVLMTVMCVCLAAGVCLLNIGRIWREHRLGSIALSGAATLLLNLFFLIPLLMYSADGVKTSVMKRELLKEALEPSQILMTSYNAEFPLEIGLPLTIGVILALAYAVSGEQRGRTEKMAGLCILGGAAAALMATKLFPWALVDEWTRGLSDYLQFPWRMLAWTTLAFSLAGAYGYSRLVGTRGHHAVVAALVISAVTVVPILTDQEAKLERIEYGTNITNDMTTEEYNLPDTNLELVISDIHERVEGGLIVEEYEKHGMRVTAQVSAAADGTLDLPLFAFDGYAAEVDGKRMETGCGPNNRLQVYVPAGTEGTLNVFFEGKTLWRVGDAVSLITAVVLAAYVLRRRRA